MYVVLLSAQPRFHVGANEFKNVGLLPVDYRVTFKTGPHLQYYKSNGTIIFILKWYTVDTAPEPAIWHVLFHE